MASSTAMYQRTFLHRNTSCDAPRRHPPPCPGFWREVLVQRLPRKSGQGIWIEGPVGTTSAASPAASPIKPTGRSGLAASADDVADSAQGKPRSYASTTGARHHETQSFISDGTQDCKARKAATHSKSTAAPHGVFAPRAFAVNRLMHYGPCHRQMPPDERGRKGRPEGGTSASTCRPRSYNSGNTRVSSSTSAGMV